MSIRNLQRGAGFALVVVVGMTALELCLQAAPPADLHLYLGDPSPLHGQLVDAPELPGGVRYRDLEALLADNPATLGSQTPENMGRSWLFVGSSFVNMRGALCDTTAELLPAQPCVTPDRTERLVVRFAQARTLLASPMRPQRLVFALMPVDTGLLVQHELDAFHASTSGGLVVTPRAPPDWMAGDWLLRSRIALTTWIRLRQHEHRPDRQYDQLCHHFPEDVERDFRRLFTELAREARSASVPVTVVFIPNRKQSTGRAGFAFQDGMTRILDELDIGVVDPRAIFVAADDIHGLYIHDGHLSRRGYRFVARELARTVGRGDDVVWPADEVERP